MRYTGPKHKLARREGVNILDKQSSSLQRRLSTPPGVHGGKKKRKRPSEYGIQLREKQKAKSTYGLMEKQFKKLVQTVQTKKGESGEMIVALLETRLDNMVYRLGFAKSRFHSRQLVSHGHVWVNDKKLNIPSYQVKEGDIISISPRLQTNPGILKSIEDSKEMSLPFIKKQGFSGKLLRMPKREDIDVPFNLQMIIEYYSR